MIHLDLFPNKSGKKASTCKSCQRELTKQHYNLNKSYYTEKARAREEKLQKLIREAKSKPCADCRKEFHYCVMDFDHLYDKRFKLSSAHRTRSFTAIQAELLKCEVVCSNCHRLRTFQRMHA
jgi:hypothetical protein